MQRVLVIDDDVELCELLAQFLKAEGFDLEAVTSGEQGVARARSGEHVLVVLDVMLPGMQGFEVLRQIRAQSHIPVLMLTARGDDFDRILGLELGADDYLPKPFNPRELAARIRAILRRAKPPSAELAPQLPEPILLADLELDHGARVVRRGGEPVNLTTVEFQLWRCSCGRPDRL
jgi:DNA-binding response OmpR family regulator